MAMTRAPRFRPTFACRLLADDVEGEADDEGHDEHDQEDQQTEHLKLLPMVPS